MSALVVAHNLHHEFEHAGTVEKILTDISLEVSEREFVTVMGQSGSGKSTLLHCLSGMEKPSAGEVQLNGSSLFEMSERKRTLWRRRILGFVFQFFNLLPDLSVRENLELPILIVGDDPAMHKARIDELVELLGLTKLATRQPHGLSGGEMQRVSIARALALRPSLILADEPTGNLSSKAGGETMDLFARVREQFGTAILLVTHNPRDAAYGDRVLFLKDGSLDPDHALTGQGIDAAAVFSRLEELGI